MARATKTREIDGIKYECTQFDIRKSLRIMTRFVRHTGGPIGAILKSYDSGKNILDQDLSKIDIGGALEVMMANVSDDEVYGLCKDICSDVMAVGEPNTLGSGFLRDESFDMHFKGESGLSRLFKVVKFALEANYSNFLSRLVAAREGSRVKVRST